MKLKAEMGAYSSVVGNSVHLIADDGRMIGQVAILCHTDDLRDKDVQADICHTICDAINAKGGACTSWIDGDPPRDGRFYLGMYADRSGHVVRRWDGSCWRDAEGEDVHEFAAGHGSIFWPEPIHDWPTREKGGAK